MQDVERQRETEYEEDADPPGRRVRDAVTVRMQEHSDRRAAGQRPGDEELRGRQFHGLTRGS